MRNPNRWVVSFALALGLPSACREPGGAPLMLPTADPLSEGPTASPDPALPPPPSMTKPKLAVEVVTGSPDGFLVTSTIVSGKKEAVLVDAQFTLADARRVVAALAGKKLTTVFVTHVHPDHYFGFPAIKETFPDAKLVALPQTVSLIQGSWEAKVKQWKPTYKDAITSKPILPEPLAENTIDLEGQKLEIVGGQQGDSADNAYVWIPSLGVVVTGDIAYDGVFPWTAETTPEERKAWAATLDRIAALGATKVVPGHRKPERVQQASSITFTKEYLSAYDDALASAKSSVDLQAKIKERYPDTALDEALRISADAAFPAQSQKKRLPAR